MIALHVKQMKAPVVICWGYLPEQWVSVTLEAQAEHNIISSADCVDLQEYLQDRFIAAFDPIPLDHSLAVQAQT
jgi:hypothetical protein